MIEVVRRSFLTGLGAALIAAPAIVRAGSLMPVKATAGYTDGMMALLLQRVNDAERQLAHLISESLYADGNSGSALGRLSQKYKESSQPIDPTLFPFHNIALGVSVRA